VDRISKSKRSQLMARVKQKDTAPELTVRRRLHALGYRFTLHSKKLPGTPDIILPKHKAIIFVHGCFWHGHNCKKGKLPETRKDFWKAKINKKQYRDSKCELALRELGYRVLVAWECEAKDQERLTILLQEFLLKELLIGQTS
jgi:DNA mismatch endonuclease, patch repair protein